MSVETITKETVKGKALNELQGLKTVVLAGAGAATNIPVTGLKVSDTIQSVLHQDGVSGVMLGELSAEASIPTAGNLQISTTVTTGNKLILNYWSKP